MVSDEAKTIERSYKKMKKIVLLALLAVAFIAAPVFAAVPYVLPAGGGVNTGQYHSYDGLVCTDCHTLHNSDGGVAVASDGGPNRELLKRGDWTDMCLSCHKDGQNTSATAALIGVEDSGWVAPIVMTTNGVVPSGKSMPAGDFYWSNLDPKKGHNPAYTKGAAAPTSVFMAPDTVLGKTPPGGTITDGEWSCHSCHGMHARFSGSYSAYRQLKRKVNGICIDGPSADTTVDHISGDCGTGVVQDAAFEPIKSNSRGDIFGGTNNTNYVATRGDGNALQGADLFADYGDTNKNVYQGGFSSFCSACHGLFHGGNGESRTATNANTRPGTAWIKHPTNVTMDQSTGSKYGINTYKATIVNSTNTNPNPVGYDFKYPLVKADADFSVTRVNASMADTASLATTDRIMCLTCHQAHASPFENMTRWDSNGHAFTQNGGGSATEIVGGTGVAADGDNPAFGCGKCHQKGGTKAFVKTGF